MSDFSDLYGIKSADRAGKGVTGLPDTPGLSTGDMQARFDSLANLSIDKFNAMVNAVGDVITNDTKKLPTMAAIVSYVIAMGGGDMVKSIYDTNDDGIVDHADTSDKLNNHGETYYRNQYVINVPTSGYTTETVTIWGESKELKSIIITTDKDGNSLTNFSSGMNADYPVNLSASDSDIGKFYAFEIQNHSVKLYFTDTPTTAFRLLIKEAI